MKTLIDALYEKHTLPANELLTLLSNRNEEISNYLFEKARATSNKYYGNKIYTRGLIEFTNYCKNDCYYCGIRKSNRLADRYRLTKDDILACAKEGYDLGFRTFVLQGGEDAVYNDQAICDLVASLKTAHPDCAITLSIGEKSYDSYLSYYQAGADRYLLRHETANSAHYNQLHPLSQTAGARQQCLYDLKSIGYQVGTGFMVGSPFQTLDHILEDLLFIQKFKPDMVGIGPFIPHHDTPFKAEKQGTLELTLFLLGIIRLMLPYVLLPATTALGTIDPNGREKGILAGANVVMPNLSPVQVRKKYSLYDHKICTGEEAAECRACLSQRMKNIGYELVVDRGDAKSPIH